MRADLLIRGAEFLEMDAENPEGFKFDLSDWGESEESGVHAVNCGTTACAMGAWAVAGIFPELGLENADNYAFCPMWTNPKDHNDQRCGFGAAAELFGISFDDARKLFDTPLYKNLGLPTTEREGELAVAKMIRDYVENGGFNEAIQAMDCR